MGEHTHGHAYHYTHQESVRHAVGAEARSVNTQLPVGDKPRTGGPPAWPAGKATFCICLSSPGAALCTALQTSLGTLPHPQGLVLFTGME